MKAVYTLGDLESWREPPEQIRFGVLGDPVVHSLSPPMQNAALTATGRPQRYARFQIAPNELEPALRRCSELGFIGVNLTVPHKIAGFSLVDEMDAFARQIGAINTIRFADRNLLGANTDGPGFERGVAESFGKKLSALRVLVLGAGGGAGQAVVAQCAMAGCPSVALANRDFAKAERLVRRYDQPAIFALPWSDDSLHEAVAEADLIVNATPLGLQPDDPSPLPEHLLRPQHFVYDLNYRPSKLVAAAHSAGARAAHGLTILLHQGALAFEFWFERPAPISAMRLALGL